MPASATRWLSQANADAALKFAPTRTALAEALQEAKNTYGQTVQAGNSTATLTEQAAKNAQPAIHQVYAGATGAQQAGQQQENAQLAALPGVANTYKAEAASEAQTQLSNLLGAKTRDESMLHQSGVAAREGAQFNQLNAAQALQKTLTGLFQKSQTGAAEQGDFAATTAEKLAEEAEKLEQKEAQSVRSSTTSENNSRRSTSTTRADAIEGHKVSEANSMRAHPVGGASVVKPIPSTDQAKASSEVLSIRRLAQAILHEGHNRAQAVSILSEAEPAITHKNPSTGATVKVPGRKAYAPNVLMSAALDEAEGGHLSANTVQRLKNAGYSIQQLGLHPPDPREGEAASRSAAGATKIAKTLQHALGG